MNFYHVTTLINYHVIQKQGQLIPQIGPRSQSIGEIKPRIYLFNHMADCDDAVVNWLGDEFSEIDTLVYLKIKLDFNDPELTYQPNFYESYYDKSIPFTNLQIIKIEPPA